MSVAEFRLAFASDVIGEHPFSRADIALARACANLVSVVEDDPDGVSSSMLPEIESGTLTSTRHSALMRSMLAKVV
jgi:hypothetical protein